MSPLSANLQDGCKTEQNRKEQNRTTIFERRDARSCFGRSFVVVVVVIANIISFGYFSSYIDWTIP